MSDYFIIEFLIGIVLAIITAAILTRSGKYEASIAGFFLFLAGAFYPIFGIFSGQDISAMQYEIVALVTLTILALAGIKYSMWFLAVGWFLHGPWDLVVPHIEDVSHMPFWYAGLCLGFDLYIGVFLGIRAMKSDNLKRDAQPVL